MTFLWRGPAESGRVHLPINRVTDKQRQSAGCMARVPGTDIWARTLEIAPTLRTSYGFHSTRRPAGNPRGHRPTTDTRPSSTPSTPSHP